MSLVAGTRWSFQRIRVQIDRRLRIRSRYEATGGYCLGASQHASGGTADISPYRSKRRGHGLRPPKEARRC
jgi:hypothetical protein